MIPHSLCLVAAIQTCIQLLRLGLPSPHREARLRRRELRQRQLVEEEDLVERMKQLQAASENKQRQLEAMRKVLFKGQLLKPKKLTVGRRLSHLVGSNNHLHNSNVTQRSSCQVKVPSV